VFAAFRIQAEGIVSA